MSIHHPLVDALGGSDRDVFWRFWRPHIQTIGQGSTTADHLQPTSTIFLDPERLKVPSHRAVLFDKPELDFGSKSLQISSGFYGLVTIRPLPKMSSFFTGLPDDSTAGRHSCTTLLSCTSQSPDTEEVHRTCYKTSDDTVPRTHGIPQSSPTKTRQRDHGGDHGGDCRTAGPPPQSPERTRSTAESHRVPSS